MLSGEESHPDRRTRPSGASWGPRGNTPPQSPIPFYPPLSTIPRPPDTPISFIVADNIFYHYYIEQALQGLVHFSKSLLPPTVFSPCQQTSDRVSIPASFLQCRHPVINSASHFTLSDRPQNTTRRFTLFKTRLGTAHFFFFVIIKRLGGNSFGKKRRVPFALLITPAFNHRPTGRQPPTAEQSSLQLITTPLSSLQYGGRRTIGQYTLAGHISGDFILRDSVVPKPQQPGYRQCSRCPSQGSYYRPGTGGTDLADVPAAESAGYHVGFAEKWRERPGDHGAHLDGTRFGYCKYFFADRIWWRFDPLNLLQY
jgi:hypothetical protein